MKVREQTMFSPGVLNFKRQEVWIKNSWMNMKRTVLVLVCSALAAWAQGGSGLTALQIGSSARATAMAEAYSAVAQDASAPLWNPAGMARMSKRQLHLTHNEWIQGINHEATSLAGPGRWCAWGLYSSLTSVGDIEQRTSATEEPLATFSAHTFSIGLALARKVTDQVGVGLSVKYLYEKIYVESANGYAVDVGLYYLTPIRGLTTAAVMQNFGAMSALYREKTDLPKTMRLGVAYLLPLATENHTVQVAADYVQVFDQESYVNVGVEMWPLTVLALRTGYASNHSNRDWTMGFGLSIKNLLLDYAYVPFKQSLGNTHQFSLTFNL
jgi:hypothetical protein